MERIAQGVPINASTVSFTDPGLPNLAVGPPDHSFDHANFYYRAENAGPFQVSTASANSIGCSDMGATPGTYSTMIVRIIEGTGRGQERTIASNDASTLMITPNWSVGPDTSSVFVITEPSWRFAAVCGGSPVQFEMPYRSGTTIQISGRAANVNNLEGTPDLCPLTRWALGQSTPDAGLAPVPSFSLSVAGDQGTNVPGGSVTLSQIGFASNANIASVSCGTLQLHFWNELNEPSSISLSDDLDASGKTISLAQSTSVTLPVGSVLQIDAELVQVGTVQPGNIYGVVRGTLGSTATNHVRNTSVLPLSASTFVVPFVQGFFENRASVNFMHTIGLPDIRIAAAELFLSNAFGDGQTGQICYTGSPDGGLRTLSGGQFSLQVSGPLATQTNAAPPLLLEASHAVRDVVATLNQPAIGFTIVVDLLVDGSQYCQLSIPSSSTVSHIVSGLTLLPLHQGSNLSMNVTLQTNGNASNTSPGRDLTVTVRL